MTTMTTTAATTTNYWLKGGGSEKGWTGWNWNYRLLAGGTQGWRGVMMCDDLR